MQSEHDYLREYKLPSRSRRTGSPFAQQIQYLLRPPAGFSGALGDGMTWIGAAAVLRLGVEALILSSGDFWLPGLMLMAAPAIVAVGLTAIVPQLSLILGYRLLLVAIGLLLGGRV